MKLYLLIASFLLSVTNGWSESITVYYDSTIPQLEFAAKDIKAALEEKQHKVSFMELSALKNNSGGAKVVIALASNTAVVQLLKSEGRTALPMLGEQAYVLRTTSKGVYWVVGGDENGAMYGGLQLAENFNFDKTLGTYNSEESPTILKRGIKFNLPFDKESTTYFSTNKSNSAQQAIPNVWDMSFWTTWFDEMARYRYNVISIWNNHPFTSMIKMEEYPDVVLNDVTGYNGFKKKMSIDEKIVFWKQVMAYAKARGFEFYLFNWNLFVGTAKGKYGITEGKEGLNNPATIAYLRKCMITLLETYPDLDGFGITQGEKMANVKSIDSPFLGQTYGQGMADYAKAHPNRKLRFIHRWHMADFNDINNNYADLLKQKNVVFDMSFKYSEAHMYSNPVPQWLPEKNVANLKANQMKSWLTVRNDDYYYHNWGDPNFARTYINGMPGKGDWLQGFYMGSDGYHPTRTFFAKNAVSRGQLEIQRQWLMFMIWGRISYNPTTSDNVFKNYVGKKYPETSSENLFAAWRKASSGLPKVTEIIHGTFRLDFDWWPEACLSKDGFVTAVEFGAAKTPKGSIYCTLAESAANKGGNKKNAYALADEIEKEAMEALALVEKMKFDANTHLGVAINNIKAMSYLTIYYAHKLRGATYLLAGEGQKEKATAALGSAYAYWMNYTNLMDKMYEGMIMERTSKIPDWHFYDKDVLDEYRKSGGTGIPKVER